MRNLPSNIYLMNSLTLASLKWFGNGAAVGRNCLSAIKACAAITGPHYSNLMVARLTAGID